MLSLPNICSCTFELHESMLCALVVFAHGVHSLLVQWFAQSCGCSIAVLHSQTLYLSSVGVVHRWQPGRLVRVCKSEGACRSAAGGPHGAL